MTRSEKASLEAKPLYDDTPDDVFEVVEKTYDEAEASLITYVEKQVEVMNSNLLFGGQDTPSFAALQQSLMEYEPVLFGLTALHSKAKFNMQRTAEEYDNFWAVKYIEVRTAQQNLGKSGFTNVKDIEYIVRKTYMTELAALKAKALEADNQYNTITRLVSCWEKYAFILQTMSKNAQAEAEGDRIARRNPYEFGDEDQI